jgi:anti-sigma-K factor RskA
MCYATSDITTALISDYAGGRLDAADARGVEAATLHDEAVVTRIVAARQVNLRMIVWFVASKADEPALRS